MDTDAADAEAIRRLPADEAAQRVRAGATILLLPPLPVGAAVGIDTRAYAPTARFRGWKGVPPGVPHLVHVHEGANLPSGGAAGNSNRGENGSSSTSGGGGDSGGGGGGAASRVTPAHPDHGGGATPVSPPPGGRVGVWVVPGGGSVTALRYDPPSEALVAVAHPPPELLAAAESGRLDDALGLYPPPAVAEWAALLGGASAPALVRAGMPPGVPVRGGEASRVEALAPAATLVGGGWRPPSPPPTPAGGGGGNRGDGGGSGDVGGGGGGGNGGGGGAGGSAVVPPPPPVRVATPSFAYPDRGRGARRRPGMTPAQISAFNLDRSDYVEGILASAYGGDAAAAVAELALAYVSFSLLWAVDGLDVWASAVGAVCGSGRLVADRPGWVADVLTLVTAQLRHAPAELFGGGDGPGGLGGGGDGSLRAGLARLDATVAGVVADAKATGAAAVTTDVRRLAAVSRALRAVVRSRYGWELRRRQRRRRGVRARGAPGRDGAPADEGGRGGARVDDSDGDSVDGNVHDDRDDEDDDDTVAMGGGRGAAAPRRPPPHFEPDEWAEEGDDPPVYVPLAEVTAALGAGGETGEGGSVAHPDGGGVAAAARRAALAAALDAAAVVTGGGGPRVAGGA